MGKCEAGLAVGSQRLIPGSSIQLWPGWCFETAKAWALGYAEVEEHELLLWAHNQEKHI